MDWSRLSTLILSISSVLAALTTIVKFGKDFVSQVRSAMAGDNKPLVIERPRLLFGLIGLFVVSVGALLFLRSQPQKPDATAKQPVAAAAVPAVAPAPAAAAMVAQGNGVVVGGQSGTGNDQKVIGTLTQSGSGCVQNVGIGDNNTLNCKPVLPAMSSSQVEQVSKLLAGAPKISGNVKVLYETTEDENGQLAKQLSLALVEAGIPCTVEGHGRTISGHEDYPGLSIEFVDQSNVALANAIEKALLKAKVILQPLEPADRNMKDGGNDLVFVVRDPA